jgi:predicted amidophosphoribosyltransferase
MPVAINPRTLRGPWQSGFALDVHTVSSTFLGHNSFGHAEFETVRSPLGDLLYRLKNGGDQSAVAPIVEAIVGFLRTWKPTVDVLVPVPPSNRARRQQPVITIATQLSVATGIPVSETCVRKIRSTAQLKDVFDYSKRTEILKDAFAVNEDEVRGRRLLILDDLYRSGATVGTIAQLLSGAGAAAVYLLTLTQTRKLS